MERAFKTHNIRKTNMADSVWDFKAGEYNGKIAVPSCWEIVPELSDFKGDGEYTKTMTFGGRVRLAFKGVGHTASVYCDGELIAEHYGAYTPFNADIDCEYGEHEIKIIANNTYNENTALHKNNDYYAYGGIIRPLIIEQLNDIVIEYIHFTPYRSNGAWWAKCEVKITNKSNTEKNAKLQILLENDEIQIDNIVTSANSEEIITYNLQFENVNEYSLKNPFLYKISAIVYLDGIAVDDLIDRVGFREIKTEGKRILLNGEPIRILGFNRHEDYNSFGSSIPIQGMMRDIALMKEAGANAVRTSHYPNDELFLDLCDEMGLLVWEEGHARGLKEEHMAREKFLSQSMECVEEMIVNHFNHPSIFCWGILNESCSYTEYAYSCYKTLYDKISELDSSRPKTSAAMYFDRDLTYDLEDIVSMNIYPSWYDGDAPIDKLNLVKSCIAETGNGDKPFIISEIGAGAIYGYRNDYHSKWTEERQAEILNLQLTQVLSDSEVSGVFIWQFSDCRVDEQDWFDKRPRTMNNKGIVDEYRRKKLAFETVKRIFTDFR